MDEIPEGLDDLLNSILGKKKSNPSGGSSALAISSKAKKKQSVKEDNIEEIILRLLGLDDVSDIDYDTYKTLLREKMAAGRMSNSQMPTEEVELLTDEFKRVKSKTGRFKPKPKKKVKADAFFSGAIQRKSAAPKKQGPAPKTNLQDDVINEIQKIKPDDSSAFIENTLVPQVNKISENLNSIVDTLNKQFQLEKKSEKKEASAADTLKKKTRETKLETPEKDNKFKSAAKVALKPAGNFFDMILDFFKNILLGGALLGLIEILKDPSKAFQPFVDFVNKFIDFINSISTWTNENILGPINAFIGGIFDAFNALEDNVNKALALFGQEPIDNIKEEDKPVLEIPMIPQYENPFAPQEQVEGLTGGGQINDSTGQRISGMGADTQQVALSPGEVVMSNKAGDYFGRDTLLAMNAMGGGTNRSKMGKGNLLGFQNGGLIPGSNYDVILPLDHVKPENMYSIPDTPGGNTFKNARATGADGRERQHQDSAARIIRDNLVRDGVRTKIVTPEQFGNYQDYDKYLMKMSSLGTRVVPLHFDAKGSIGFLTRSSGRKDDMAMNRKVFQELAKFQKNNPGLGGIGSDTKSNATINRAASSPATLVEMGVMVDWESKYGKNFTQSSKFRELADSISGAIKKGGFSGINAIPSNVPLSDPTQQQVQMRPSNAPLTAPGAPDGRGRTRVVILPPGGQNPGANPNSASSGSQSTLPKFSATDPRNTELIVIKSIYNIVG